MKSCKNIIRVLLTLYTCGAILSSCGDSDKAFDMNKLADSQFNSSEFINSKSIINIPLETSKYASVYHVESVRVTQEYIFILNNVPPTKTLLMFGRDGQFIRQISNVGYELNEYTNLVDFDIDEKLKRIYIDASSKILEFSFSGNYISSVKTQSEWGNGSGFRSLGAGKFLIARGDNRGLTDSQNHRVLIVNNDGQTLNSYIPRPEFHNKKMGIVPRSFGFFAVGDAGDYYIPVGSDSIYMVNSKGDNKFIREFGLQSYIMQPDFDWNQYRQYAKSMLHPLNRLCVNNKGVFSFIADYNQVSYTFVGTLNRGIKAFGRNVAPSMNNNWPGAVTNYATYRDYFVTVKSASEALKHPELFPDGSITADDNPIVVLYKYKL